MRDTLGSGGGKRTVAGWLLGAPDRDALRRRVLFLVPRMSRVPAVVAAALLVGCGGTVVSSAGDGDRGDASAVDRGTETSAGGGELIPVR